MAYVRGVRRALKVVGALAAGARTRTKSKVASKRPGARTRTKTKNKRSRSRVSSSAGINNSGKGSCSQKKKKRPNTGKEDGIIPRQMFWLEMLRRVCKLLKKLLLWVLFLN